MLIRHVRIAVHLSKSKGTDRNAFKTDINEKVTYWCFHALQRWDSFNWKKSSTQKPHNSEGSGSHNVLEQMKLSFFSQSYLFIEQIFSSLDLIYFKWILMFTFKSNSKQNSPCFNTMISHINLYVVDSTNSFRNHGQVKYTFS